MTSSWFKELGLFLVSALLVVAGYTPAATVLADKPPVKDVKKVKVRGKIVRMKGPDQYIVRTDDNKEVVFYTNRDTRYVLGDQAGRYSDLRVGAEVSTDYVEDGDRYVVHSVLVGRAPEPQEEGELVEGSVIRVVGDNQVIVKSRDGKEITIYVSPETKYLLTEQPGRFTDLRTGSDVRVYYDVRDKKITAHRVLGPRRK